MLLSSELMAFLRPYLFRIIGAAIAVFLLIGLVLWYEHSRSQAAQSRLEQGQTEALSNSAHDAIATEGAAAARETTSEDLTRTNQEEIRHAKGADAAVDPAARDAGLRALCRRAAYRDSQRCRVQPVNP